jgi:YgiT-type zinc finger domain-containing protein
MAIRSCGACGGKETMTRFENEDFAIVYAGQHKTVHLLCGWRCKTCDEIMFDRESADFYAAAGDALVLEAVQR